MTEKPASAFAGLGKDIVSCIKSGFDAYTLALQSVTQKLLDEIDHERHERRQEIKALRAELADVKYALREQLHELNGRQEPLQ